MMRSGMTQHRALRRPVRHGALTVEMALVVPVLLVLILGIMQVGYAFMVQHALQDVARQGCRMAALRTRSQSAVTTAIQDQLRLEGVNVSKTTTNILVNNTVQDISTAQAGDEIRVQICMGLADVALFPGFFSNFTGTVQGNVTMRCD
jgi:Flp pilus assembly protein TadG